MGLTWGWYGDGSKLLQINIYIYIVYQCLKVDWHYHPVFRHIWWYNILIADDADVCHMTRSLPFGQTLWGCWDQTMDPCPYHSLSARPRKDTLLRPPFARLKKIIISWSLQLIAPGMFCAKHETFWISKNATCENSRGGLKRGYTSHWSKWLFTIIIAIGNHKSDLLCYALSLGSTRLVSQMLFMAGIHEA